MVNYASDIDGRCVSDALHYINPLVGWNTDMGILFVECENKSVFAEKRTVKVRCMCVQTTPTEETIMGKSSSKPSPIFPQTL